ncbi:cytosolic protein [Microvirga aerilata]|uniref:Cytosolic protein n=1 Tax=Microvirga aerilata TaxID=670292 RepID=A0A936ZJ45_9HYPH|nr:cytosolic protein [Microvirga aerilata]MBL0408640.1 cytosolic protein [Microvirga aerilata]
MKAALVFAGSEPIVILTSYPLLSDPGLLRTLKARGVGKIIAYELPLETVAARYGGHFQVVMNDACDNDDPRVLDIKGNRAFRLFRFSELGPPVMHYDEHIERTETAA